jgi:hypothetical protein
MMRTVKYFVGHDSACDHLLLMVYLLEQLGLADASDIWYEGDGVVASEIE